MEIITGLEVPDEQSEYENRIRLEFNLMIMLTV